MNEPFTDRDESLMREAIRLARHGVEQGHGGPFGAVIAIDGEIVGRGWNQVVLTKDPTAHAEIIAIREACKKLDRFHLPDATLYTSCEPCPMCLSAAHWAHIKRIVYAAEGEDARAAGFNDLQIRDLFKGSIEKGAIPTRNILREESQAVFRLWQDMPGKTPY
jgi:tRNA(Arg) A34 adenosine deaminase TadA